MKLIVFFLSTIFTIHLTGQLEDNIQLFGQSSRNITDSGFRYGKIKLDFTDIDPRVVYDSTITMSFRGANASLSSSEGDLLMYTNGMQIFGEDHQPITGGDTIAYSEYWDHWVLEDFIGEEDYILGFPIIQSIIILPINDRYFCLYNLIDENDSNYKRNRLAYSIIEYNLDNKLEVVLKDEVYESGCYNVGFKHAVRHANGRDWWMLSESTASDTISSYLVSHSGEITKYHTLFKTGRLGGVESLPQLSFSPSGEQFAAAHSEFKDDGSQEVISIIELFDFDRCSGAMNLIGRDTISLIGIFAAVSFSPNGRYIYASSYDTLYQYDVQQFDWQSSRQVVAVYDGFRFYYSPHSSGQRTRLGPMFAGSDGRIYSVPPGSNRYLNVIDYPNEEGESCQVNQHKIFLDIDNFRSTPNVVNFRLGPIDGSVCDSLGIDNIPQALFRYEADTIDYRNIRFTDLSFGEPQEWYWDFGDGTTHDGDYPYYHKFASDGVYNVCLTASSGNGSHTYCKTLYLGVTSADENDFADHVSLYPNPARDLLSITISDYHSNTLMAHITTVSGHLIQSVSLRDRASLVDVSRLSQGLYFLRITDGNKLLHTETFIKL